MCLIKNNAKVAAQIAVSLANLQSDVRDGKALHAIKEQNDDCRKKHAAPVVIGGSILDVHYRVLDEDLKVSSNNFSLERSTSCKEC